MTVLNPNNAELGPVSPILGPWFWPFPNANRWRLAPPDPAASASDLSVPVVFAGGDSWLPPASGILSLYVNAPTAPKQLSALRGRDGSEAPFGVNSLVALHTLLPEVSARLDAMLSILLGQVDGIVRTGAPARERVKTFALEWAQEGVEPNISIWDTDPTNSIGLSDPPDRSLMARKLGLKVSGDNLTSDDRPMTHLRRPGFGITNPGTPNQLIQAKTGFSAKLWVFDQRGYPIDPGAVAAWWSALAADFVADLWEPTFVPNNQVTVATVPMRTAQLVDLHQAAPSDANLASLRIDANPETSTLVQTTGSISLTMDLPAGDPPRRLSLLPNGTLATDLDLWDPSGNFLPRDFVRVALADPEAILLGQERSGDPQTKELVALTGPRVHRSPSPVLLSDVDASAAALIDVLDGAGDRTLITGVLDRDFGAIPPRTANLVAQNVSFPNRIQMSAQPIVGGGRVATEGRVESHRVLVTVDVDPSFAGAWVRAWPQGFDSEKGRHIRLDGGAAPVGGDGFARLVVQLPAGAEVPDADMSMDVMVIVEAGKFRHYAGLRFARPAPVGGDTLAVNAVGNSQILVCEGSAEAVDAEALANVPPGSTLLALTAPNPTLIDLATVPAAAYDPAAALPSHLPGLRVELTPPAFGQTPTGDSKADLEARGAIVNRPERVTIANLGLRGLGAPFPLQERCEVMATHADSEGQVVEAAIGSTPTLSRYHELLPHQLGHPGAPGAVDIHGTGARLSGQAAIPALELARDRTVTRTDRLANAAATPFPDVPESPDASVWTALLQTVAAGTEGEGELLEASFPFSSEIGSTLVTLQNLLRTPPPGLPTPLQGSLEALSMVRAILRRARLSTFGAREGWRSLRAAIKRAQDFIYIETPWLDTLQFAGAPISPFDEPAAEAAWTALESRLKERKSLRVILCLPSYLLPGTPRLITRSRNQFIPRITDQVMVFSPSAGPGRSLKIASTTAIIDDVYALTGTTHLSRRGMTYDSSVAVAAVGEQLENGRSIEVREFGRSLLAGRLGLSLDLLPEDPEALFEAIFRSQQADSGRFSRSGFERDESETPADSDDALNPDGSPGVNFNVAERLAEALDILATNLEQPLPPEP